MSDKKRECIDCIEAGITTGRDAPHPGPRCATHWRAKKKERSQTARARRWESVYSITAEQYAAILEIQGGVCGWCGRANGRTKALSVDHDHSCCDGPTSCGRCVRGILCGPCNVHLGYIRDSKEAVERIAEYLKNPPARRVLDIWRGE
ncbi:recombination endonuclease VII [Mycobacterium phage Gaia]|uniref:Recombination endonuclease VII n=1 Tax=Mycobacterium phage Gaia TaxID=1486472 RepID=A0A068F1T4_9CAUD|nr:endonuclease VII [Mycobacterium phage Gaia]AID58907.1 recombination endonuclease VII [Mycobacterium phage Gaia]AYR00025.1 endonuclease VII [Mycobacterium phage Nebkiss]